MNTNINEVIQHLECSLSTEFDYSDVNISLNFLLRRSFDGKKIYLCE